MKSIKKKVFGILASMAMVLSLFVLPISVNAANENAAKIGNQEYATLRDALSNAQDGQTIVLLNDIKEDLTIGQDKNFTLDLNGHTITNVSNHTITNNGNLTIVGNGTIDNVSHGKAAIQNEVGATMTLNGGTYTRSQEKGTSPDDSGSNSYYNIVNHGTMTINNGVTVKQNGHYSSMVENGWYNGNQNTSKTPSVLTINGGTFTGGLNTIKNDDYGQLTINDGTIKNVSQSALLNWNEASIHGGNFTSETGIVLMNGRLDNVMDKGILNITGGQFISKVNKDIIAKMSGGQDDSLKYITITGGTFSSDVEAYVAKNYTLHKKDGQYVVAPSVKEIELSTNQVSLEVGGSFELKADLTPATALDTVVWSSDNKAVATVDQNGNIKAVAPGKATITATAGDQSAKCEVTVYKVESKVEVPSLDTSKPVDKVTVAINDKESQKNISATLASIVDNVANGKEVTSVSKETAEKIAEAIDNGQVISTEVQVENMKAENVTTADKTLVEKAIDKNANVGQYFDISIVVKAENKELGNITKLDDQLTFTVAIPEELKKENREFSIVRVHEGKAEKLDTVENKDGTLTFKTDKFSTYALVYVDSVDDDTPTPTPNPNPTPNPEGTNKKPEQTQTTTTPTTESDKTVKTDDNSNTVLYGLMITISVVGAGIVVLAKKREELLKK